MLRKQSKRGKTQRLNMALSQANGRPPPAVVFVSTYILDIIVLTDTKPRRATAARPPRPLWPAEVVANAKHSAPRQDKKCESKGNNLGFAFHLVRGCLPEMNAANVV